MDRRSDNATSVDVEIDPHRRRLGRSQTDFALQAIVECRAAKAKRVAVLLRWHADGGEVRRGRAVGETQKLETLCYPRNFGGIAEFWAAMGFLFLLN